MRKNETADMMHYWYMMGCYYSGYRDYRNGGYPICTPNNLQLGGTPLNHAIVAAMSIIPSFKTKNGIQKVNAVFLTDGVSHRVSRKVSGESLDSWKNDVYITDKQTNTTITSEKKNSRYYSGENQTTILLELLKKRIPESNILGFFVAGSGARGIVRREIIQEKMGLSWTDDVTLKKYQKELRTNKVLVCKTAGYDEYYILPSIPRADENDEDGIEVKENAKSGDLKNSLKKLNILIGKFPENIFLLETKGDILRSHGFLNESSEFYKLVLKKYPENYYIKYKIFLDTNTDNMEKNNKIIFFNHNINLIIQFPKNKYIINKYIEIAKDLDKSHWINFFNLINKSDIEKVDEFKMKLSDLSKKTNDIKLKKIIKEYIQL